MDRLAQSRSPPRTYLLHSYTIDCELDSTQTPNFGQAGTEQVTPQNIPIAQFSGDGPDWREGRARITAEPPRVVRTLR